MDESRVIAPGASKPAAAQAGGLDFEIVGLAGAKGITLHVHRFDGTMIENGVIAVPPGAAVAIIPADSLRHLLLAMRQQSAGGLVV